PNTGLADLSNVALVLAIATYAVAMVAYAFDFAFGKRQTSADSPASATSAAAKAGPRPELVAAAVGTGITELAGRGFRAAPAEPAAAGYAALPAPAPPAASPARRRLGTWQRLGFLLTCAGLVMHLAAVATRGLAEHRIPWGNMFEFIAAITCAAVLVLVVG